MGWLHVREPAEPHVPTPALADVPLADVCKGALPN
jgi:hypothetical protein